MEAVIFWEKFHEKIHCNSALCNCWDNMSEFTKLIMDQLQEIITEKDCETQREYFRIDLISYRNHVRGAGKNSADEKPLMDSLKHYSWDLVTAVEHENAHQLWMDEVVKLAHVACELRVVIGYLPEERPHETEAYLEKVAETLAGLRAWRYTRDCGDFLIIIGDCKLSIDDAKHRCVYTPYIYNKAGSFEKLKEKT